MPLMVVILGIVVSLDGFAAALSYGAQRIRMSPGAVLVISAMSAGVIYAAMLVGQLLGSLLPAKLSEHVGAALLVVLGGYLLFQHSRFGNEEAEQGAAAASALPMETNHPIAQINLRVFGLVIQILRHPSLADRDHSGVISWQESILLGLALALDAFGAGLGAAMTGLAALPTSLTVGGIKVFALVAGWELGFHLRQKLRVELVRLPGVLLIFLGLFNLLFK